MKITIIGGSQGTGAQLAALAVAAGHDVTTVSRSGTATPGARALRGDATDAAVATEAVTGADAVVVTVGAAKGVSQQRAAVTRAIVAAMCQAGTRRLVVQSSLGAGDSATQLPGALRLLMKVLLASALKDHNEQEAAVTGSGLDWTIVRPTGLSNAAATARWQALAVGDEGQLRGSIPRADLAACILATLGDDSTIGAALGVSS